MRTTALSLSLLLAAAPLRAASPTPQQGEGAQRLVSGAVKLARRQWKPDACLGGLDVSVNVSHHSDPPGPSTVYYNGFTYYFRPPGETGTKRDEFSINIIEAVGPLLNSKTETIPYNVYTTRLDRGGDYTDRYGFEGTCVTEMSVDSGEALYRAMRSGLIQGGEIKYHAILRAALDAKGRYYQDPRLFGRTFWIVGEFGGPLNYYIDAKTGALLAKLKP
ncbi:MAG: hypothetical protein HY077_11235 [Elusimicrobia bacterium]|nr:hypothetical protein [Elusimicrobiota bacterium]